MLLLSLCIHKVNASRFITLCYTDPDKNTSTWLMCINNSTTNVNPTFPCCYVIDYICKNNGQYFRCKMVCGVGERVKKRHRYAHAPYIYARWLYGYHNMVIFAITKGLDRPGFSWGVWDTIDHYHRQAFCITNGNVSLLKRFFVASSTE